MLLLALACREPTAPADEGSSTTTTTTTSGTESSPTATTDEPVADASTSGGTGDSSTGEGSCESVDVPLLGALRPAGVIVLVDNTPGMGEEAAEVSARLGSFAALLGAELDRTIVMISAYPADDPQGVCVDPPLGNGGCPASDHHPPEYLHLDVPVTPLNAISHVFVTHDQWADALASGAKRHVVVVSDGDTGVTADDFAESFTMLDPEANAGYRLHVSVAHGACEHATTPGTNFRALAEHSGGYDHDLCTQDYATFFEELGARILEDQRDRCRFELPSGPAAHPDHVELLIDADGLMTSFPRVGGEDECIAGTPAWHWEDPASPTVIQTCPETCTVLQGFATVEASARLGCPPE